MSAEDPLVSIQNVDVEYSDETALMEVIPDSAKERFGWESHPVRANDDVSLDIGENEVIAVVGESGSGKTTLGKTAVALQRPTNGTVEYRGQDVWEVKRQGRIDDTHWEDVRRSLQIIHQDPGASLNPYRTLMSILKDPLRRWYPEMSNADYRERVHSLFQACDLTPAQEYETRYPHQLSGGEQQRVTLVRAMLAEPDLIFADEPVGTLDTSLRIELMDLMLELQEQFQTSFMFVSHNLENARYMAAKADGRLAVMYLGEIVEIGPVDEVIQNPQHPYTQILKWGSLPYRPEEAREALSEESPLRKLDIPDVVNPPSGCKFHTRCPKAKETCAMESPELVSADGDEHLAACYRQVEDHEYWDSEFLDERGEIEIPAR